MVRFLACLFILTGIVGCDNTSFLRNKEILPPATGWEGSSCDVSELDRTNATYQKEYNRLWSSMTTELFSESVELDKNTRTEARAWQQKLKTLELRMNAGYRSVMNACLALDQCQRINYNQKNLCSNAENKLRLANDEFYGYDRTLRDIDNELRSFKRDLDIPSFVKKKCKKGDPSCNNKSPEKKYELQKKKECTSVGTVFQECD